MTFLGVASVLLNKCANSMGENMNWVMQADIRSEQNCASHTMPQQHGIVWSCATLQGLCIKIDLHAASCLQATSSQSTQYNFLLKKMMDRRFETTTPAATMKRKSLSCRQQEM